MRMGLMIQELRKDSVGAEVVAIYDLMRRTGHEVFVMTATGESTSPLPTYHYVDARWLLADGKDLLVYFCCGRDDLAVRELRRQACRIALRFYGMTPSKVWAPYSAKLTKDARIAINQLQDLAQLPLDAVLCASESVKAAFEYRGISESDLFHIPMFHRASLLAASPDNKHTLGQLAKNSLNLVTVGPIVPAANLVRMVETLAELDQVERSAVHLHVIGELLPETGPYVAAVSQQIDELGLSDRVTFYGDISTSALATFYRHADAYWSSSNMHVYGPVVEAMSFGNVIISPPLSVAKEICGEAAVYVESAGEEAAAIRMLFEDGGADALRHSSKQNFDARYRLSGVSSRFTEILSDLDRRIAATISANDLPITGSWFDVPNTKEIVKAALVLKSTVSPRAIDGRDRRLDLLDWAFREGWRSSEVLQRLLSSKEFAEFMNGLQMPRAASHLPPQMKLAWHFNRVAQATFDFDEPGDVQRYTKWFERELMHCYWKGAAEP